MTEDEAFPETGGYRRSRKDTNALPFEFRRTREVPTGHTRTLHQDGSGP